jgi:anthranilate phosphoribosyltransferase
LSKVTQFKRLIVSETIPFPAVFAELQAGMPSPESVTRSFEAILAGSWNAAQVAGFLTALRIRGESAATIAAAARAMRSAMVPVKVEAKVVLDTCGTGGDGSGTLNLSTAAAIVCAALGVTVAKHGNRAISSQAGSADVLSALGLPIEMSASAAERVLREVNIAFLLAPVHHPSLRHAMPVRRELGVRTIFNCLGPLANPARASHQLLGAFSDELRPMLASTLKELGTTRAWVVRGVDGLDEVTPYAETLVTELDQGVLREFRVAPEDFGLARSAPAAAAGGDAKTNAKIIEQILQGAAHPARDAVVLNAAAALVVARGLGFVAAANEAAAALDNGQAAEKLAQWRRAALAAQEAAAQEAAQKANAAT